MTEFPKKTLEDWQALANKECKGRPLEELTRDTPEGIAVKPLYSSEDLEGMGHLDSMPGLAPFVRGPKATMYAGRPWTVRQYAGFSTAEDSNAFYRKNLEAGQTGLSVALGPRTKGARPGSESKWPIASRSSDEYKGLTAIPSGVSRVSSSKGLPLHSLLASACQSSSVFFGNSVIAIPVDYHHLKAAVI